MPLRIRERVPLAPLTTLGVGGEARFFFEATSEAPLFAALEWARSCGVASFVLGGGSNVLVSDAGLDGLVVRVAIRGIEDISSPESAEPRVFLRVGAGEPFDPFVERCVGSGYAGLECMSGIPGLVGATPIQNVGAYGQEVAERIVEVRAMDRSTGKVRALSAEDCRFAYRTSVFKNELRDACTVITVTFALSRGGAAPIRYAELSRDLAARGVDPTSLGGVRDAVLALRRSKSMVIDPADPNHRSAGSFFVNPIVDRRRADEVEAIAKQPMPRFPAGDKVKLSAGWLIERAGFPKGSSIGNVGLSTRHALAIVNKGGASAAEILGFAGHIRRLVLARFGIGLVPEPVLLGFSPSETSALDA